MSISSLFRPSKISTLMVGGVALVLIIASWFLYSLHQTNRAIDLVKATNFTEAQVVARRADWFPRIFRLLTGGQSTTLNSWHQALSLTERLESVWLQANFVARNWFDPSQPAANLNTLHQELNNLATDLQQLELSMSQSWWLRRSPLLTKLETVNFQLQEGLVILSNLATDQHTLLVLLQNTEEIRASGGFIGSYAKIVLNQGKVENFQIQDIYEPDGQFTGFIEAPAGAREYLSGGRGLRLPDANWHADFPSAAPVIASYFAWGKEKNIDTIITLNVDLVEKILKIGGEIYLPDYGLTATADNLTALARSDRNAFFAGSKQKANFLTSLFTHLKLKLSQLSGPQLQNVAQALSQGLIHKDLQLFSSNPELQQVFLDHHIAGALDRPSTADWYFYQIESNVGINKANKKIRREVKLELTNHRTTATTIFFNNGQDSLAEYINYHRLLLDPSSSIQEIIYNGQPITQFDEEIITNSIGQTFKQIGLVMAVPPGTQGELVIAISHPPLCQNSSCQIAIQKQSGLPPTPYTLTMANQTHNLVLEQDEVMTFDQL